MIHNAKETPVIPVKMGIYAKQPTPEWIPAYAGMTAFSVCSCE
jgi:hypothetical protein